MSLRTFYLVSMVAFYLSLPIAFNIEKLVFMAKGFDTALLRDTPHTDGDRSKIDQYYAAYEKASPLIVWTIRFILFLWTSMLVFSIYALKKRIQVPYGFNVLTLITSGVLVLVTVVPMLLFGRGWPPRPF